MKTLLYKSDGNGITAIGNTNPLPVTNGYNADNSFNVAFYNENASGGSLVKAGTSGKSIYITDISFSLEQAGEVWLYEGDGTVVLQKINLAANGNYTKSWVTPIKLESGEDLWLKTDGAIHVSADISGYVV